LKAKKGKRHKREKESRGKKKLFRVPYPKISKRATFFCGTERSTSLLLQKRDTQTTRSAFAAFAVFAVTLLLSLKATRRVDHTYISKSFFSAVGVSRNKDRKNKRR